MRITKRREEKIRSDLDFIFVPTRRSFSFWGDKVRTFLVGGQTHFGIPDLGPLASTNVQTVRTVQVLKFKCSKNQIPSPPP